MKKLKIIVAAILLLAASAQAEVRTVGQTYDPRNGDFTIFVKATEPWVVWMTTDFVYWTQMSGVQGAGRRSWTEPGAGFSHSLGFYVACPKSKPPHRGWHHHYGWTNNHEVIE
jgi:hypothetical protein